MKIKNLLASLYKRAVFLLTVPKCTSCGEFLRFGEEALCAACHREYERIKYKDCSICAKPLRYCECTNEYLERHFVHRVAKVFRYISTDMVAEKLPSNELIYHLKREKRHDLISFAAKEIAAATEKLIKKNKEDYLLTSIPRQRARVKKYGHDHAAILAKRVAKILSIKYEKLLVSKSKVAQKKTIGRERYANAKFDYYKEADLSGKRVIILDDLITTGASVGKAAMLIKALGAKEVMAASLAIAYRDTYRPFEQK